MDNLIQLIGQQVTPEILRKASAMTGESEAATQAGLNALLPTLVGAFAHKGANENGAKKMMDWVSAQGDSDQFLNNYSGMFDNSESSDWLQDTGGALVSWLMGSKATSGAGMISSMAGIGEGSSSTLMKVMAPLALAVIGKSTLGGNMGAGGLASMLLGQKSFLQAAAPAGLMGLLGLNSFDDLGKVGSSSSSSSTTTTTTTTSSTSSTAAAAESSTGVAMPTVSTGAAAVTGAVAATGAAVAAGATGAVDAAKSAVGGSVPSFQSGNVAASGISTPSVSAPSVNIETPSVSAPSVSVPDMKIETPSVSAPSVSVPDVKIETPSISTPSVSAPDMNLPDVDLPTATVDVSAMAPAKPLFTKVEADKRDFAFKSGRPDLPSGSAAGATTASTTTVGANADRPGVSYESYEKKGSSAAQAKSAVTDAITEVVTEEKPLFNKVWLDKRDTPMGNYFGRWFGWTVVTTAVSAGVLAYFNAFPGFLSMLMGS